MTKPIPLAALAPVARARRPPFPAGWAHLPLQPADLTLANTLPVGQSFLWHRRTLENKSGNSGAPLPVEEFSRAVDNPPRVVCLRQTPAAISYAAVYPDSPESWDADQKHGTTKAWLEDYFQLRHDLPGMYDSWRACDPKFFGRTELGMNAVGVRVLRQEPWECLIAFITSANNNISRITSLLHKLSARFSPTLLVLADDELVDVGPETTYRLFPRPAAIAAELDTLEATLRDLGFGYRANYISSTLEFLQQHPDIEAELLRWRTLPLPEVRERLLELKGVGRKVADCVMLMCMDQPSLIPIDTHIYNIASRHPGLPSRLRKPKFASNMYDDLQAFLADAWGPMGGWCQAVVFAAELERRKGGKEVVEEEVKAEVVAEGCVTNGVVVTKTKVKVKKETKKVTPKREMEEEPSTRPKRARTRSSRS